MMCDSCGLESTCLIGGDRINYNGPCGDDCHPTTVREELTDGDQSNGVLKCDGVCGRPLTDPGQEIIHNENGEIFCCIGCCQKTYFDGLEPEEQTNDLLIAYSRAYLASGDAFEEWHGVSDDGVGSE